MGLISNADDEGRLPGNAMLIKSIIFPYDNYAVSKIEDWLLSLCKLKIIIRYKIDDQTYIQVVNFLKHQTINRPTPSKIPEFSRCNDDSMNAHGELIDSSLLKENKGIEEEGNRKESRYSIEFETWYSSWPRPEAKADSAKNFEKKRKEHGLDYILQCSNNYKNYYHSLPLGSLAYQSNNFFGQKAYYLDYELPKEYTAPSPQTQPTIKDETGKHARVV